MQELLRERSWLSARFTSCQHYTHVWPPSLLLHVCVCVCASVYITGIAAPLTPFSRVPLLWTSSDSAQSNNGARKVADARYYNYTRVMIRVYAYTDKREIEGDRGRGLFLSFLISDGDHIYITRPHRITTHIKTPHLFPRFSSFASFPILSPHEISRHSDASRLQSSADIFHFARSPSNQPFTGRFKVLLIPDFIRPTDPRSDQSLIRDRSRNALRMFIREAGDERERGDTLAQFPITRWCESVSHVCINVHLYTCALIKLYWTEFRVWKWFFLGENIEGGHHFLPSCILIIKLYT